MSTPTFTDPRAGLLPGLLHRQILAAAITFALDSVRAGEVEENDVYGESWLVPGLVAVPGFSEPLVWRQDAWVKPDTTIWRDGQAAGCGTGCCIAGWISLTHSDAGFDRVGLTDLRSTWLLVGVEDIDYLTDEAGKDHPGLPAGVTIDTLQKAINHLYSGDNDLTDVIAAADRLLALYGQPPLQLDPAGTFQ